MIPIASVDYGLQYEKDEHNQHAVVLDGELSVCTIKNYDGYSHEGAMARNYVEMFLENDTEEVLFKTLESTAPIHTLDEENVKASVELTGDVALPMTHVFMDLRPTTNIADDYFQVFEQARDELLGNVSDLVADLKAALGQEDENTTIELHDASLESSEED